MGLRTLIASLVLTCTACVLPPSTADVGATPPDAALLSTPLDAATSPSTHDLATMAPSPDLAAPPCADCLTVQEWGTYTSVEASDGHALGGVHHVDEALPVWVHSRNWSNRQSYFFEDLPEEPLQQLETPVLYFWSPIKRDLRVDVQFPEGVVGEWYPDATTFQPAIGSCKRVAGGSMSWNITVDPAIATKSFAPVAATEIWAPSRAVASTPVGITMPGGATRENEQFIFYRGLATFDPPVHVVTGSDGKLHVHNASTDDLKAVFVLDVRGASARIVALGSLAAGATLDAPVPSPLIALDAYVLDAQAALHGALVQSGLVDDVATAMVNTWTRSWFRNEGLRVLYLAPRTWADRYLPLTITPAPSSLVRTLVGRIEVLPPSEEQQLLASVRQHTGSAASFDLSALGRFAEPRLRRTLELMTAPGDDRAWVQQLIDRAHAQP